MHFEKESAVFHKTAVESRSASTNSAFPTPLSAEWRCSCMAIGASPRTSIFSSRPESLKLIHEKLEGLGYVPPFKGARHLRDTDIWSEGSSSWSPADFPGDGKPKPVSFPDPAGVAVDSMAPLSDSWNLPSFIDLKLASGLTNPLRGKDLVRRPGIDAAHEPGEEFADRLDALFATTYRDTRGPRTPAKLRHRHESTNEERRDRPRGANPRRHHPHVPEVRPGQLPQPDRAAAGPGVAAFEHLLFYGDAAELTEEELANAVRIDPSRSPGSGRASTRSRRCSASASARSSRPTRRSTSRSRGRRSSTTRPSRLKPPDEARRRASARP